MNAVKGGLIQRNRSTERMLAATQSATSPTIARSSRLKNDLCCATRSLSGHSPNALHDDRVHRNIVKTAPPAGLYRGNLVDDIHALGHARENGVAEVTSRVIEKIVVLQINEELRGCAVDVIGARHGQRTALVLEAVIRLILDRWLGFLLGHVF